MNKSTYYPVLAIFFFLGLVSNTYAQDPNGITVPKVIPPGPTSQEFQRFLGYSADGATGTTNISIPLYTLNVPGLSIPFGLQYNSSGVKVSQSIGVVGLGWSLFPGLRITRTIMGKSDNRWKTNNIQTTSTDPNYLSQIATPSGGETEAAGIDGQFDIFTLHLPNYNGSFIVKWNGSAFSAVSIPDAPLKIAPINSADLTYGFAVTDDKGIVYTFGLGGGVEYAPGNTEITAWMLQSITLPGVNNTVTFSYATSGANNTVVAPTQSNVVWDDYTPIIGDFSNIGNVLGISGYSTGSYYSSGNNSAGYDQNPAEMTITSVTFPNGSINFTYNNNSSVGYLQTMQVLNAQSTVIKTINFSVNSSTGLLQSVQTSGENPYTMQYRAQSAHNVFDQDRWGYFNNKGNTVMYPQLTLSVKENVSSIGYNLSTVSVTFSGANKDTDTAAMKANVLQKIAYPTGGWSSFVYEPHAFLHNGTTTFGGGLRIKQINTYDPVSNQTMVKSYTYGSGESGLANLVSYPEDDSFLDVRRLYAYVPEPDITRAAGSTRRVTINSQSRYRYFGLNTDIWYDVVTEYSSGGKTMYYYQYTPNVVALTSVEGHYLDFLQSLNSLVFSSPVLIKKEIYKGTGSSYSMLRQDQYNYSNFFSNTPNSYTGLIVNPTANITASAGTTLAPNNDYWGTTYSVYNQWFPGATPFVSAPYSILTGINQVTSSTSSDYSGATPVTETTTNSYGDAGYKFNLTSKMITNSDGNTYTDNFYYPTSASIPNLTSAQQSNVTTLLNNNRLTEIVEKTRFKNGSTPVSGEIYDFNNWGNNILLPQTISTQTGTSSFESRLTYNSYETNTGNVADVSKSGGPHTSYQWGYNHAYPVAMATNASAGDIFYDSFEEGDGNTTSGDAKTGHYAFSGSSYSKPIHITDAGSYNLTYWQWNGSAWTLQNSVISVSPSGGTSYNNYTLSFAFTNKIDDVRLYPLGSQMSTFTYDPLVGMTSSSDAKCEIVSYEYDAYQRLINIRDKDGNITKHYDYNYQH